MTTRDKGKLFILFVPLFTLSLLSKIVCSLWCDLQTCLLDTASEKALCRKPFIHRSPSVIHYLWPQSTLKFAHIRCSLPVDKKLRSFFLVVTLLYGLECKTTYPISGALKKKCYIRNWKHSQNSNKVILIVCICRPAFSQCKNCVAVLFKDRAYVC